MKLTTRKNDKARDSIYKHTNVGEILDPNRHNHFLRTQNYHLQY